MASLYTKLRDSLNTVPRRFQVKGVRFVMRAGGNCIIGDEMGLGKTLQTIAYLTRRKASRPVVVVCPASIKYNWQRELKHHANIESDVGEGRKPRELSADVWILNYDIFPYWSRWLKRKGVTVLVIDECQYISNRRAKRSVAVVDVGRTCEKVIALSGTPINNAPVEFFTVLNLVAPRAFPSWTDYAYEFCGPKEGFAGRMDFRGASNLDKLHRLIKPYMIRRVKSEVLKELPKKTRTVIPIRINMKEYREAESDFIDWLRRNKGPNAVRRAKGAEMLVRLGQLRQLAARGKVPAIATWLKDWKRDNPGRKLVVFGIHKEIVHGYADLFPGSVLITGNTKIRDRVAGVQRFQTDPKTLYLFGNIKAAGVGLTLTAAAHTAHVEFSWVPTDHDQAEDRVLRIGQTADAVGAYYFVALNTIEERLMDIQNTKRDVIGQVLDGKKAGDTVGVVLDDLLRKAVLKGYR